MPKISVIVPVYNVEKYLNRCIDSILNQSYSDFELILVDDGSPDNSGKICDEYAQMDERVRVIHKENGGVSLARNAGIDNARGEYITFIDSDDSIKGNFLESAIAHMDNVDLYVSGLEMITINNGEITKKDDYTIEEAKRLSITELYENVNKTFPQICICGPTCKIYKANIIKDKGISFEKGISLGEDTLFNLSYCEHIEKVYFDKGIYYTYYRENENSLFSKYHKDIYEIHIRVYDKWRELIAKIGVNQEAKESFEQTYVSLMIGCIHHVYKHTRDKNARKEIIANVISNEYVKKCRSYNGGMMAKLVQRLVTHGRKGLVRLVFNIKYR